LPENEKSIFCTIIQFTTTVSLLWGIIPAADPFTDKDQLAGEFHTGLDPTEYNFKAERPKESGPKKNNTVITVRSIFVEKPVIIILCGIPVAFDASEKYESVYVIQRDGGIEKQIVPSTRN
jgi:hypothetical protein